LYCTHTNTLSDKAGHLERIYSPHVCKNVQIPTLGEFSRSKASIRVTGRQKDGS